MNQQSTDSLQNFRATANIRELDLGLIISEDACFLLLRNHQTRIVAVFFPRSFLRFDLVLGNRCGALCRLVENKLTRIRI